MGHGAPIPKHNIDFASAKKRRAARRSKSMNHEQNNPDLAGTTITTDRTLSGSSQKPRPHKSKKDSMSTSIHSFFGSGRKNKFATDDDGSISSKSSYMSAESQTDRFQSAVMEIPDGSTNDDDTNPAPFGESVMPQAPGTPEQSYSSSRFQRRSLNLLSQSMPPGLERRSAHDREDDSFVVGGTKKTPLEMAPLNNSNNNPPRNSWDTDEEMGDSSDPMMDDSMMDDTLNTEAIMRQNKKDMAMSPVLKGFAGLVVAIIVVLPLAFAGGSKGKEEPNDEKDKPKKKPAVIASNSSNATITNGTGVNVSDKELLPLFADREFASISSPMRDHLHSILPNSTVQATNEAGSPQHKAFQWLLEDPLLEDYEDWEMQQRMAMATIYYAFDGPNWKGPQSNHWMQYNKSTCEWLLYSADQETCASNGQFARLRLDGVFGFDGSMPPQIGLLSGLQDIQFQNLPQVSPADLIVPSMQELTSLHSLECKQCQGEASKIPNAIAEYLPKLQHLALSSSQLTGPVPSQLGLMTTLTSLDLNRNYLESAIPSELGNLSLLNELSLKQNNLIGTLPTELKLLSSLTELKLGSNSLEGSLPTELRQLTNLDVLGLAGNQFTGEIPWFHLLRYLKHLSVVNLRENKFAGILPSYSFRQMENHTQLHTLDVGGNQMNGEIPPTLGLLPALTSLSLNDNNFSGMLPDELSLLTGLQSLNVMENNALVEEVPRAICDVAQFDFSNFQFGWCEGREDCCD